MKWAAFLLMFLMLSETWAGILTDNFNDGDFQWWRQLIVGLRINETLQTGAVRKPHLPGDESVYLFFEFTINSKSDLKLKIYPLNGLLKMEG